MLFSPYFIFFCSKITYYCEERKEKNKKNAISLRFFTFFPYLCQSEIINLFKNNIMIKQISLLLLLLVAVVTETKAENYPYRSDVLWVTAPNHDNWLYECGEKPKVEVEFYKYGIPRNAEVTWTIANDLLTPDTKGSLTLKNGRGTIVMRTRKEAGFSDLVLKTTVDGKEYTHHVKVGFSVDKIRPFTKEPSDFTAFWDEEKESLKKIPPTYTRERAEEFCTDKILCDLIKIQVDKRHSVYAYLTYPRNAEKGKHPAVVCPPGAGIKTIKEPLRHKYYAENGFLRLEMEIHGLDPRLSEKTFKDIQSAFATSGNNYLENGLDNRDNYYMKHVYLSLLRAIEFMKSLPEWDGRNLAFQGGSQGGALALIAAGLSNEVTCVAANHPALSDMAAYSEKGRTGGYPHFNRINGMMTAEKIRVMAYYDVVNFSRHITCPVFMTWGYNDNTCPPTTSYAVWNTLTCEKTPLITPINEHWTSEDTERAIMEWIKYNVK